MLATAIMFGPPLTYLSSIHTLITAHSLLLCTSVSLFTNSTQVNLCEQKKKIPEWQPYFLAKEIFMAFVGVILKLCRASLAAPAWTSVSNSTKAMS